VEFIATAARAVRQIGLGNSLGVLWYTLARKRMDRRWPPPRREGSWHGPGLARGAEPTDRGLRIRFERAELEVSFLTPDLVEVTWARPPFEPPLFERRWPEVRVDVVEGPEGWTILSSDMEVSVSRDGALTLTSWAGDGPGRSVEKGPGARAERGSRAVLREELPPEFRGDEVRHRVRLAPGERLHGLGERAAGLNLRGGRYRMWNLGPGGVYGPGADPIYICVPAYVSRGRPGGSPGYLSFYANTHPGEFDLGRTSPDLAEHHFKGGGLRYYLALGPVRRALERYAELTGRPALPPLWAFGYHQCRWSYYPDSRVRRLAEDFARHRVPVDAIHLDIHYMDGYRVFTVDRRRFPDLGRLARDLADQGVRLVTIIDPGVKVDPDYFLYRDGLEKGVFATLPDGRPALAPVWPGTCAFPDFTTPEVRRWWGDQYRRLLEQGVAGFWHDMNEPSIFTAAGEATLPSATRHALGDHRATHNLYGYFMNQAAFEGLRRAAPERRPFIVSRSGWAGSQRWAWCWTGDVNSEWTCLELTLTTLLGLGLSGQPFSGSDVGGFHGVPSAELYLRWLQMSAFVPFFRSHTVVNTPDQEPWSHSEPYLGAAREFIRLRYTLLPYIYTLAWEASERGWPPVRPLFWLEDEAPEGGALERRAVGAAARERASAPARSHAGEGLYDREDVFLCGEALLVAPVLEEGRREREVPVPAGPWYDYWTDRVLEGPGLETLEAPLERIPLLVRGGAVLPAEDPAPSTARRTFERLYLHVYPPAPGGGRRSLLYLDEGDGFGPARLDVFGLRHGGGRLELTWTTGNPGRSVDTGDQGAAPGGLHPWPYREVVVVLHGTRPAGAEVDGRPAPLGETGGRPSVTCGLFQRLVVGLEP